MEFNLVQNTTRAPFNKCYLCDSFEGPFIDTFKDQFGYGAVHVCSGCVAQMAMKLAWIPPNEASVMQDRISEMQRRILELESVEKQIVLSESDLKNFFKEEKPKLVFATEEKKK